MSALADAIYGRWKHEHDHPRARAYARALAVELAGPRNPNRDMVPVPGDLPFEDLDGRPRDVFGEVCDAALEQARYQHETDRSVEQARRSAERAEAMRRWREDTGHTHNRSDEYGRLIFDSDCAVCWHERDEAVDRAHWQAVDAASRRRREAGMAVLAMIALMAGLFLFATPPA
jgi:hypothetical protein